MNQFQVFIFVLLAEIISNRPLGLLPRENERLLLVNANSSRSSDSTEVTTARIHWTNNTFRVNLTAFHRQFYISATCLRNVSPPIFGANFVADVIYSDRTRRFVYQDLNYFVGTAFNIFGSSVRAFLTDGEVLNAVINTPEEIYYIEPSEKYFETPQQFNAIIYRKSSVLFEFCNIMAGNERCIFKDMYGVPGYLPEKEVKELRRIKRQRQGETHIGKVCGLHIVLDHTFIHFHKGIEANAIHTAAMHIDESTKIYKDTDFNNDGQPDGIGFEIEKVSLFADPTRRYFLSDERMDIDTILQQLSVFAATQPQTCLFVCFVSRDFSPAPSIGMAYLGDPNPMGPAGGICAKPGLMQGLGLATMNTGVATAFNNGMPQPSAIVTITVAHEIGHSFGSPHDTDQCNPGPPEGNYIMFPSSTDPVLKNNKRFSPCSIEKMLPVIRNKGSCFRKPKNSVCGDTVVQEGEECDCGSKENCAATDPCCIPANDTSGNGCKVNKARGYVCSPITQPCCTRNCHVDHDTSKKCSNEEQECQIQMTCNGRDAGCFTSENKPNRSPCALNSRTCKGGKCISTVCQDNRLKDCECQRQDMCDVCCENVTMSCRSATKLGFHPIGGGTYRQVPGTTCNRSQSYCDAHGRCIPLDADGMLDKETTAERKPLLDRVGLWAVNNWYYIFLALIAVVLGILVAVGLRKRLKKAGEVRNFRAAVKAAYARLETQRDVRLPGPLMTVASRLMALFPDVPIPTVIRVVKRENSEKNMVRRLLDKGLAIRTSFIKVHEDEQQEINIPEERRRAERSGARKHKRVAPQPPRRSPQRDKKGSPQRDKRRAPRKD